MWCSSIPSSVKSTVSATVSFIGYHEKRHYKQIREVLRKLGNMSTSEDRSYENSFSEGG